MKTRTASILLLVLASSLGALMLFFGESLVGAILSGDVTPGTESYLPLVIREPSHTASLACILPACQRCEVRYCAGVCSDGCGIVCVTVTPIVAWCSPMPCGCYTPTPE
jgi:hypothetical protein